MLNDFDFFNSTIFPEYGIVTTNKEKINNLSLDHKKRYRNIPYNNRLKIMSINNKIINKIWVSPVGHLCRGECIYCCNEAFNIGTANCNFMTPTLFEDKIKRVMPYLNDKQITISFWGGSTFLSPYMKDFINIIVELLGDKYLTIHLYNDLMLNDKEYSNMIDLFEYLEQEPLIDKVITTMSPDYGLEKSRISNDLKIDNLDIQKKAEYLVDKYNNSKKIVSRVRSLILENTNIDKLLNSFEYYKNKNIYIMFDIVEHNTYSPSLEKCVKIRNEIEKNYNIISSFMDRDYFIENEFLYKTKNSIEDLKNVFYRIDYDTLVFDPTIIACPAFKGHIAFNAINYSPCALMYVEDDDIKNCISLDCNNKFYDLFTKYPDECNNCELFYVCNRCVIRKKSCLCSENPSLKFRVKWTWDCICNNANLIEIKDLK